MEKGKKKKETKEIVEETVKEKTKDFSIEKEEQRKLKGISKFIYVCAKILKVFGIIGIVGVVIAMIAVPVVTSNIKTEKTKDGTNVLKLFDNDLYYKRTDTSFEFFEKDNIEEKTTIKSKSDVETLNRVFGYLEKNDMTKLNIFVEVELILVIAVLVVEIMVLNRVYSFFKNIRNESTPFMKENIDLLRSAGKLLIIALIISIIMGIVGSVVINSSVNISVNSTGIFEILAVYVLVYIFEYGYKLQNETKGKIYSEE
jgi:hypothetical protein